MKLIPLSQGKFAQVDDADFDWLSKYDWHFAGGYARRTERTTGVPVTVWMHREIIGIKGIFADAVEIDHKDRDRLNNQSKNLRIATRSDNCKNRGKLRNKTSKFIGVSLQLTKPYFRALITVNGKQICLGNFPYTPEGEIEAAKTRDKKAKELYGEFANLNFKQNDTK